MIRANIKYFWRKLGRAREVYAKDAGIKVEKFIIKLEFMSILLWLLMLIMVNFSARSVTTFTTRRRKLKNDSSY
jgi:hypothetical protein